MAGEHRGARTDGGEMFLYQVAVVDRPPTAEHPIPLVILVNILRDDPAITLVDAGAAALAAGRVAVLMSPERAERLRGEFGQRITVEGPPDTAGGDQGARARVSRGRYIIGPASTASGDAAMPLLILANLLAAEDDVVVLGQRGSRDNPTLLEVEMTAERAEQLQAQFAGRLIVEPDAPLHSP